MARQKDLGHFGTRTGRRRVSSKTASKRGWATYTVSEEDLDTYLTL